MSILFFCISKNENCFTVCCNGVFKNALSGLQFTTRICWRNHRCSKKKVCKKYLTFVKLTWMSWLFVRTNGCNKGHLGKTKRAEHFQMIPLFVWIGQHSLLKGNMGIFTQKLMFSDLLLSPSFFSIWSEMRKHFQLADMTFKGFHQSERSVLTCTPPVRSGRWSIHSSCSSPGLLTFPSFGCIDI